MMATITAWGKAMLKRKKKKFKYIATIYYKDGSMVQYPYINDKNAFEKFVREHIKTRPMKTYTIKRHEQ
jgi:hypothetical protein